MYYIKLYNLHSKAFDSAISLLELASTISLTVNLLIALS